MQCWCLLISYLDILVYYLDNSVLPETKTLVFSIFSLVKRWKSDGPNVPDVRARPKKLSRQFVVACRAKLMFLF